MATRITIAIFEREDDGSTKDALWEETAHAVRGLGVPAPATFIARSVEDFLTNNAEDGKTYEATIEVVA